MKLVKENVETDFDKVIRVELSVKELLFLKVITGAVSSESYRVVLLDAVESSEISRVEYETLLLDANERPEAEMYNDLDEVLCEL